MDAVRLYMAFAKVRFMTQLEYRMDYFLRTVGKIVGWGSGFVTIMIVMGRFKAMGDWTLYQVLFVYALNNLAYAVGATFVMGSFGELSRSIVTGELDAILTKPVNPLVFFICKYVSAGYTSNYVMSVGVMAYCMAKMDVAVTLGGIALLVFMVLCASALSGSLFMFFSIPAFWFLRNKSIFRLFYSNAGNFVDYPVSIYTKAIQFLLTFILPYAFISYYPTTLLFNPGGALFSPVLSYMTPLVAAVVMALTYMFWMVGINSYRSSGS